MQLYSTPANAIITVHKLSAFNKQLNLFKLHIELENCVCAHQKVSPPLTNSQQLTFLI